MQTASILVKEAKYFDTLDQKVKIQQIVNGLKDTKLQGVLKKEAFI